MSQGSDTSSTALSAAFFYLYRYPNCYDKSVTEVRSTFSSGSEIQSGTKLSRCHYLRACIDEAMRISPPAGATLWREVCSKGFVIEDESIPKGCDIGCSIYVLHHNETYFPDSYVFKPDRWIPSTENPKEAVELARSAFNPFSISPRACAGKTMAYMELNCTLAKTVWYLDYRRPEGPLGLVGQGADGTQNGRNRVSEFQLQEHLTNAHDEPYLEFRRRQGTTGEELFFSEK